MSDDRPSDVLGSLPRTRPHRRSEKRGARPAVDAPAATDAPELTEARASRVAPAASAGPAAPKAKPARSAKPKPKPKTKPKTKPKPAGTAATGSKRQALEQPPQPAGAPSKASAGAQRKPGGAGRRRPATVSPTKAAAPARRPPATRPGAESQRGSRPGGADLLGTAVQAAAELAEIGLSVGARAVRRAVSRLPRP
jgi:hypothetical protein